MKLFTKNVVTKKILIVLITIVMVSNFIMPNYVCAADPGQKIVSGFFYLLSYIGDSIIQVMQKMMLGYSNIGNDHTGYRIAYSPGMIFSNEIPALDINFINPMSSKSFAMDTNTYILIDDYNYKSIINRMTQKGNVEHILDWWQNETNEMVYDVKESYGYYDSTSVSLGIAINEDDYLKIDAFSDFLGWVGNLGTTNGARYEHAAWYNGSTAYMLVFLIQDGAFRIDD